MCFLSYVTSNFVSSSFCEKLCPLYNFKAFQDIFMKLHTNIKHRISLE